MINSASLPSGRKLDEEIKYVKGELHGIGVQKQKLVIGLGEALEGVIKPEAICTEIKKALEEEIEQELISRRLIELYCPDKWKKKRGRKSEKISLSHREVPAMVIDTEGNVNPALVSSHTKPSYLGVEPPEVKPVINEINSPCSECPDCKVYIQKIQELEEALEKSSVCTAADPRLAARGQNRKEFAIPVEIDEIQHYMRSQENSSDLRQILVIAYLDIETGKVLSVYVGEPHDTV